MNEIEELKNRIATLEKMLEEEKKFRTSMNKRLQWEQERSQIEADGLRKSLVYNLKQIAELEKKIGELNGTNRNKEN